MYPVYLKNVLIRHVAEPRGRESVEEFASVKEDEGVRAYKRGGKEGKYLEEEAVFEKRKFRSIRYFDA